MCMMKKLFALCLCLCMLMPLLAHAEEDEAMNILLIGVDTIREEKRGRSDTMMLMQVNADRGEVKLVSFLRDLYVNIPGVGKTRLNAAYYHGGAELLKQTLLENFGVRVDKTAAVHFSTLMELVDEMGGIEVEITEKERKALNGFIEEYNASYGLTGGQLEAAGLQQLSGKQALCYSRIRKLDSDFHRTSRQQAVIAAMLSRMRSLGRWELMKLALANLPKVDTDLTLLDAAALAPAVTRMQAADVTAAQVPFEGAYRDETVNGMMVLVPDLAQNRAKLETFLND